MKLKWQSKGKVTGYKIYFSDGIEIWSKRIGKVESIDLDSLNLTPGIHYVFRVTTYNDFGESKVSGTISYLMPKFVPEDNPKVG